VAFATSRPKRRSGRPSRVRRKEDSTAQSSWIRTPPCPRVQRGRHQTPSTSPQRGSGSEFSTTTAGWTSQSMISYGWQSLKSLHATRCKGSNRKEHNPPYPR
ncbi:unnamed protein product, partial [Ectocarpus sp. 12 AP-2014]